MNYEYISMDTIEENNKLISENEKLKDEIKSLSNRLEDKFMSNYPFIVENGIIVKKNKEIAELLETIDKITSDASKLLKRIDKVKELIENDYFEDGSFENYDKVMSLLRGEDNE